jgi:plastocyanin
MVIPDGGTRLKIAACGHLPYSSAGLIPLRNTVRTPAAYRVRHAEYEGNESQRHANTRTLRSDSQMPSIRRLTSTCTAVLTALLLSACGGDHDEPSAAGEEGGKAAAANAPAVKPTGKSIDIKMITDSRGERYDPVEVTIVRGDSLRFLLESGVHNVNFLAAKNPPGAKLPPMSEYLQLPGQKLSYLIDFPEGRYYYQCDIHVLLGMIGHVNVKNEIN